MCSVRNAEVADVPAIRSVARSAWHATYDDQLGVATVDRLVDSWYDPAALRADLADDDPFVVAERAGAVLGFAQGVRSDEGEHVDADEEASLSRLYVHPDEWGRGVGTALLGATARRLRPATTLRVVVMATNEVGRAFYDRHGFSVRERRTTTLEDLSFEVLVCTSPLTPLCRHAPNVDHSAATDNESPD